MIKKLEKLKETSNQKDILLFIQDCSEAKEDDEENSTDNDQRNLLFVQLNANIVDD